MGLDQYVYFRRKITDPAKVSISIMEDIKKLADFKEEVLDGIKDDATRGFHMEKALNDFIEITGNKVETCSVKEDEEVMYWRKGYEFQKWFINNTNYPLDANLYEHPITREDLEQLVDDCKEVLSVYADVVDNKLGVTEFVQNYFPSYREKDLGFFIDVKRTIETLEPILGDENYSADKGDFVYYEWW